jgi:beta-1,4-mannosyltransferase
MIKAYIYPRSANTKRKSTGVYNPYRDNFMHSVGQYVDFVNRDKRSSSGLFHLVKFLPKIDMVFFNWVENVPDKKYGYLQSIVLLLILRLKKLLNIEVVWTLHNKISHSSKNLYLKELLFKNLLKHSDIIITHAIDGIEFAEQLIPGVSAKFFYFPHPIVPFPEPDIKREKKYDILIWGSLHPYKGIDTFLDYLDCNHGLDEFRIMIAGKASSEEFFDRLKTYSNDYITIRNEYVSNDELSDLFAQSRYILFTYNGESVLSSGALVDSIARQALVIGPAVGAFKELGTMGIIKTYSDFAELLEFLKSSQHQMQLNIEKVNEFMEAHSWEEFASAFKCRLFPPKMKSAEKKFYPPVVADSDKVLS